MPPLTPLDIQHKEFTKAMRGYAMHEVDTFLDQITEEFTRLQDEIARLREQAANTQVGAPAVVMPTPQAPPPPPPQHQPAPQAGSGGGEEAIARALVMAQRMADQTVEEAKAKSMVAESEARAKSLTEQSQMRAREITEAAQMRARELTEAAQMRAREVTEAAQARARELTEGLETRYKERIQSAEARARVAEEVARRRQELESSIEALRAFERDYRARLRGFVEGQLKALEDAAPSGPVAPPQPPGMGGVGNSRPLPGSEDLPALSTGARQVNNSYSALRDPTTDQLGNGRDRVVRQAHHEAQRRPDPVDGADLVVDQTAGQAEPLHPVEVQVGRHAGGLLRPGDPQPAVGVECLHRLAEPPLQRHPPGGEQHDHVQPPLRPASQRDPVRQRRQQLLDPRRGGQQPDHRVRLDPELVRQRRPRVPDGHEAASRSSGRRRPSTRTANRSAARSKGLRR